jgi:acyl-CoA reductase-like NAD-dependent aldehyde dehydrogenase
MSTAKSDSRQRRWTAAELRQLPPQERNAILEAAAALAESDYCNHAELTAFEAFGKDDLYGDSADAAARRDLAD